MIDYLRDHFTNKYTTDPLLRSAKRAAPLVFGGAKALGKAGARAPLQTGPLEALDKDGWEVLANSFFNNATGQGAREMPTSEVVERGSQQERDIDELFRTTPEATLNAPPVSAGPMQGPIDHPLMSLEEFEATGQSDRAAGAGAGAAMGIPLNRRQDLPYVAGLDAYDYDRYEGAPLGSQKRRNLENLFGDANASSRAAYDAEQEQLDAEKWFNRSSEATPNMIRRQEWNPVRGRFEEVPVIPLQP